MGTHFSVSVYLFMIGGRKPKNVNGHRLSAGIASGFRCLGLRLVLG